MRKLGLWAVRPKRNTSKRHPGHRVSAAKSGDPAAQFNLGVLCDSRVDDNGYTIEGNRAEAMEWLLAAAEQGLPRAQSKLDRLPATTPLAHLALVRAPSSQTAERAGGHAQKIFTTLKPYAQGRR